MSIFFILGAGASSDSGLPTYRGEDGLYDDDSTPEILLTPRNLYTHPESVWRFLNPLYSMIQQHTPGPTYQKIAEIIQEHPHSFLLTQNIDGYATNLNLPVIEMHGSHKTMTCVGCGSSIPTDFDKFRCDCGGWYRPDVVLFEESLPKKSVQEVYYLLKKRRPKYVLVIGTSMQFPYLRVFIDKAKKRGAKVIHINPDPNYHGHDGKELFIQKNGVEGLEEFINLIKE